MASFASGMKVSRKQGLLLGILGTALVYVLVSGNGGDRTAGSPDGGTAAGGTAARRKSAVQTAVVAQTRWPQVSLDQAKQHNPFAELPVPVEKQPKITAPIVAVAAQPAPDAREVEKIEAEKRRKEKLEAERRVKLQAVMADLRSQKVKMIVRNGQKVSAVIGDRLVHEGDIIDGVRIVSILPNGVVVKPAD